MEFSRPVVFWSFFFHSHQHLKSWKLSEPPTIWQYYSCSSNPIHHKRRQIRKDVDAVNASQGQGKNKKREGVINELNAFFHFNFLRARLRNASLWGSTGPAVVLWVWVVLSVCVLVVYCPMNRTDICHTDTAIKYVCSLWRLMGCLWLATWRTDLKPRTYLNHSWYIKIK